ncbi:hypothetical protein HUJ05_001399 [Dendroctonus ponderosae]|nr:hypothetical protein HUJ05_001399 [Dendroctonus ponderosae]
MEIAQGCINIKQYFISALYEQLHVKASAGKEQELNKNTNEFDKRLQSSNGNKKVETRTWFHLGLSEISNEFKCIETDRQFPRYGNNRSLFW